jgi:hypothetical protein
MPTLNASSTTRVSDMTRAILDAWQRSTQNERLEGARWYPSAYAECASMARTYGVEVETAIAVLAALSPRLRWSTNVRAARMVLAGHKPSGILGRSLAAARAIVRDPDEAWRYTSSPKVGAFKHTIEYQVETCWPVRVVVDTWAVRAATRNKYDSVAPCRYNDVEQAYLNAASRLNVRPDALQATLWVHWRGTHR